MHKVQEHSGLFIALEGAHNSGKTTQARRLGSWLSTQGYGVKVTREVGGTDLGETIRNLIVSPRWTPTLAASPKAMLFLVLAARNLHVAQVIAPALSNRKVVVCERFEGSTYAIQHYGEGIEWDMLRLMHSFSSETISPDVTILFDIPAHVILGRNQKQPRDEFWSSKSLEYHERIVEGYRAIAATLPNWLVIDGSATEDQVFLDVQRHVREHLSNAMTGEMNDPKSAEQRTD